MKKSIYFLFLLGIVAIAVSGCAGKSATPSPAAIPTAIPTQAVTATATPTQLPPTPTPLPPTPTATVPLPTPTPTLAPPTENEIYRGEIDVDGDGSNEMYGVYQFNPLELPADIPTALGTIHVESVAPLEAGVDAERSYLILPFGNGIPETLYINPRPIMGERLENITKDRGNAKAYFYNPAIRNGFTYIAKIQWMAGEGMLPLWEDSNWVLWDLWFNDPVGDSKDPATDIIFGEVATFGTWRYGEPIQYPHSSVGGQGILMSPQRGSFVGFLYLSLYTRGIISQDGSMATCELGNLSDKDWGYIIQVAQGETTYGQASTGLDETGFTQIQDTPQNGNYTVEGNRMSAMIYKFNGDPLPRRCALATQPLNSPDGWSDQAGPLIAFKEKLAKYSLPDYELSDKELDDLSGRITIGEDWLSILFGLVVDSLP